MSVHMFKITKNQAEDIRAKFNVLSDDPELQKDYGLSQEQADLLCASIPWKGGAWTIPEFAVEAVKGELENYAEYLFSESENAINKGQELAGYRLAHKFEDMAGELGKEDHEREK